jgi:vesicle-associated membrane protein 7
MSKKNPTGILYAVFARQETRLCDFKKPGVDKELFFPITQTTSQILNRLDHTADARRSFKTSTQPELHFHINVTKGLTLLCVDADPEFSKKSAHSFLHEAFATFLATTKDWMTAPPNHFQNTFSRQLEQIAEKFSNPANDKVKHIKGQMNQAKEMYMEQINLLIERGEHIDILEDKTKTLADESIVFKDKAKAMKMRFFWKNIKLIVIIVLLALVALFLLIWFGCGVPDFKTCADMIKSMKGEKVAEVSAGTNTVLQNGNLSPNEPPQTPNEPEQPPPTVEQPQAV